MKIQRYPVAILSALLLLCSQLSLAGDLPTLPDDDNQLAYQIYKELIETNTTNSVGDNTLAANRIAAWLRAAGFPEDDIFIGGQKEKKGNLVARLHGKGDKEPLILLAHIDVVEADPADWSMDPFKLQEIDGRRRRLGRRRRRYRWCRRRRGHQSLRPPNQMCRCCPGWQ